MATVNARVAAAFSADRMRWWTRTDLADEDPVRGAQAMSRTVHVSQKPAVEDTEELQSRADYMAIRTSQKKL